MVYISHDGKVYNNKPWSFGRILSIILGFFTAIGLFIKSLIDPFTNPNGYSSGDTGRSSNSGWGSSSGGGGGGGGGPSGGPPRPPRRPMGRINHAANVSVPGGCSSCQ